MTPFGHNQKEEEGGRQLPANNSLLNAVEVSLIDALQNPQTCIKKRRLV